MSGPGPRNVVAPHSPSHPVWCDGRHHPFDPHRATVGSDAVQNAHIVVSLLHWSRDVIQVSERYVDVDENGREIFDTVEDRLVLTLAPAAARRLAAQLVRAAAMTEAGGDGGWMSGSMGAHDEGGQR